MEKNKSFEAFLMEKHAEEYVADGGLDDGMVDAFQEWITSLDIDDIIDYADEYTEKSVCKKTEQVMGIVEEAKIPLFNSRNFTDDEEYGFSVLVRLQAKLKKVL